MLENLLMISFIALGIMSFTTMILAFWNLKLQDENDRLKMYSPGDTPPFQGGAVHARSGMRADHKIFKLSNKTIYEVSYEVLENVLSL